MDTVMEEKRGTYTALSLSLALHVILLLAAGHALRCGTARRGCRR